MNVKVCLVACCLLLAMPAAADNGIESLRQTGKAFSSVARKVAPAVVFIQVDTQVEREERQATDGWPFQDDLFRQFFGDDFPALGPRRAPGKPRRATSQGSGFVFSAQGDSRYILTNNHVVADAGRIRVKFQDGREYEAKLQGADPKSDVAVLKIEARGRPILAWGDAGRLEVGEWVVAMGNPFGLSQTLTTGVVSAKGRTSLGISDYEDFIQTDAAINPGNSGGPLLNLDGEVVGMNTAIFTRSGGYMGVGFAIPSNLARSIAEQLVRDGRVVRGYIGLAVQPLTQDLAQALGIKENTGVLVNRVNDGSPAEAAGIRPGDVLISLDGNALTEGGQYRNRAAQTQPGSRIKIGVIREGRPLELEVKVGRLDEEAAQGPEAAQVIGLTLRSLTPAERARVKSIRGVLVAAVAADSLAAQAGIVPGSLILEANKQAVSSPQEFAKVLESSQGAVLLRLLEMGRSRYISLRWR